MASEMKSDMASDTTSASKSTTSTNASASVSTLDAVSILVEILQSDKEDAGCIKRKMEAMLALERSLHEASESQKTAIVQALHQMGAFSVFKAFANKELIEGLNDDNEWFLRKAICLLSLCAAFGSSSS